MKLFIFIVFVLFAGCVSTEGDVKNSKILDENSAVYEAVLRYAFSNNTSSLQNQAGFYAVELDGGDAPPSFIEKFNDIETPIHPLSKTRVDCNKGVYLKGGVRKGIQFSINPPTYESDKKIKVSWSYSEGCTSSAFSIMTLEFKGGVWVVLDDEILVVS